MIKTFIICCFAFLIFKSLFSQEISYNENNYEIYPVTYDFKPDIPSPFVSTAGREYLIAKTSNKKYILLDVTIENTGPFNYGDKIRWKGNQLQVDAQDFPTLAETGLHSRKELLTTKQITGRSIAEITMRGRPGKMSGAGFMAADEDIISVLIGDNQLVEKMGLIHPELAKTLLHLWNIIQFGNKYSYETGNPFPDQDSLIYNGKTIKFEIPESKGWQYSIFNDTIWGEAHLVIKNKLSNDEIQLLKSNYTHLSNKELDSLIKFFSEFHTGEMAAYYIMRYGFYEGHTDFRADPVALAYLFGFKTIPELDQIFNGKLYDVITSHHKSIFE